MPRIFIGFLMIVLMVLIMGCGAANKSNPKPVVPVAISVAPEPVLVADNANVANSDSKPVENDTTKPLEMDYDSKPLDGCRKLIEPPTCSKPQLSAADKEGYKECIAKAEKSPRAKRDMLESECIEFYMQKGIASWVQVCPSVEQYLECLDRKLDHTK